VREQPYIDQTYRYGSTMGGFFQQHQGVEFNAGEGTPIHAIGDGVVAFAGPAEAGANTVAIRHDRSLRVGDTTYVIYSTYYHATQLLTEAGRRVRAGDVIARVGNTGRATNDHLHLEVHALPVDSLALVVDPAVRYPPHSTNPELWIAPLPGTGIVAGRVLDATGGPVRQARIYGLVKPEPQETPFSFIETYGTRTRGTPAYGEHFAIGDVPPGTYELRVAIEGRNVSRWITVAAGRVTWVELRP
jgi:murein DD-endopeptidase MepM/ murein hydrolase activator NlpD